MQPTARIWPEEGGFVADCVELSVVSQGDTEEEALSNLQEAVAGFLECADPSEVRERMHTPRGRRGRGTLGRSPPPKRGPRA
jgi:predicted RNase H-like HicB family nuclease